MKPTSWVVLSVLTLQGCDLNGFQVTSTPTAVIRSSTLSFSGITSADRITPSSLRLNWTSHADAVAYELYDLTSGSPVYLRTLTAPASSTTVSQLNENSTYRFRLRAKDSSGLLDANTNDFSVATIANPCAADWVYVPSDSEVGTTTDFCVMKFEAKDVGGNATSQASLSPWVNISQADAKAECAALGGGHALMTNEEWMTIARNIEGVGENWSGSAVGNGYLRQGHSDNVPAAALDIVDPTDDYDQTGNGDGSGPTQRRTMKLSNGEILWDFSGNVWEWIDWNVAQADKAYSSADGAAVNFFRSWSVIDRNVSSTDVMKPETWAPAGYPASTGLVGIGQYLAGSGNTALRGGAWGYPAETGIYALSLFPSANSPNFESGFRCVYHP